MVCSPPGSSIHGILQARILEWVGIPFSRGPSWTKDQTWGLLHFRQILYYLSRREAPKVYMPGFKCHIILILLFVLCRCSEPGLSLLQCRAAKLWQLSLAPGANPSPLLFSLYLPRMSREMSAPAASKKLALWASQEGQCAQLREVSLALFPGGIPSISHMAGNTVETH